MGNSPGESKAKKAWPGPALTAPGGREVYGNRIGGEEMGRWWEELERGMGEGQKITETANIY